MQCLFPTPCCLLCTYINMEILQLHGGHPSQHPLSLIILLETAKQHVRQRQPPILPLDAVSFASSTPLIIHRQSQSDADSIYISHFHPVRNELLNRTKHECTLYAEKGNSRYVNLPATLPNNIVL